MLRRLARRALLGLARGAGGLDRAGRSDWRRHRLVILCYHGFAADEEHLWRPGLFIDAELFRRRLALLQRLGMHVLPLSEGVQRLAADELPPKAVCLTTDDGFADFRDLACPALAESGLPMTLYLTTWYAGTGAPVFNLMVSYLLWKGRGGRIKLRGILPTEEEFALRTEAVRTDLTSRIWAYAHAGRLGLEHRHEVLREIATRVKVDYDRLLERRILQIMGPDDVRALDPRVVNVQLHTHRHRMPRDAAALAAEIADNRSAIAGILRSGEPRVHFCYPSGEYHPESPAQLRGLGIESATTCDPGIAGPASPPLLLPRYLDGQGVSETEFEGWVTGFTGWLRGIGREARGRPGS